MRKGASRAVMATMVIRAMVIFVLTLKSQMTACEGEAMSGSRPPLARSDGVVPGNELPDDDADGNGETPRGAGDALNGP